MEQPIIPRKYFKCVGWHDGKRVSHCLNAPCVKTIPDFKCQAGLTAETHHFCRREMTDWELLELKDLLRDPFINVGSGLTCRVCDKAIMDVTKAVNVNDEFYLHQDCMDNHWDAVLGILFGKDNFRR